MITDEKENSYVALTEGIVEIMEEVGEVGEKWECDGGIKSKYLKVRDQDGGLTARATTGLMIYNILGH